MTAYHWDLAFGWNQKQRVASTNYFLQNGFVNDSPKPPTLGLPIRLQIHDTVAFCLFDVTTGGARTSPYQVQSATIQFSAMVQGQQENSPFGSSVTPSIPTGPSQDSGLSTIFSGGTSTVFPSWDCNQYTIVNNGWYELTVTIVVKDSSGSSKTFVCDPEMIIGGVG